MIQQLFFMGNKRSGTSLLVKLLNIHPEIFASHESDIVWILYQARNGWPQRFNCYPWDGPMGMIATLKACSHILQSVPALMEKESAVFDLFCRVEEHLRKSATTTNEENKAKTPIWVGDKKPVQQCDPDIRPFMQQHFPHARYLHIVRHPKAVVASKIEAAKTWKVVPEFWKKRPEHILERWAIHEEWVLRAKSTEKSPILTLGFEDLCKKPVENMERIFSSLDLEMSGMMADHIRKEVRPDPNLKYESFQLPVLPRAKVIMDLYQYA